jgi:Phosphate-selective porin O and P
MLNRKIGMTIVAGSVLVLTQAALAVSPESAVVTDASTRASLAGETGGHDGKFFLSDGTKGNRLNFSGFAQFRYQHSFIDAVAPAEDFTHGFQIRRVRLEFGGSAGDPNITFLVNADFSDTMGGAIELKDAWGKYDFGNGLTMRAGQYKSGMTREENVSDAAQLLVERSQTNSAFTWGRSQGVGFAGSSDNNFKWSVDINDGPNSHNTEYDSTDEADYGIVGRLAFLAMGNSFDAVDQFSSWTTNSDTTGVVGASLGWAHGGDTGAGTTATTEADIFQLSVDTQWGGNGWNAFAAGHFRSTDDGTNTFEDMGVIAQGGYFFREDVEGFARIDSIIPDDTGGADPFTTLAAGVNIFLVPNSQASKVTIQLNYFLDNTNVNGLISTGTNNNLLASGEDGQVGVVVQWQNRW